MKATELQLETAENLKHQLFDAILTSLPCEETLLPDGIYLLEIDKTYKYCICPKGRVVNHYKYAINQSVTTVLEKVSELSKHYMDLLGMDSETWSNSVMKSVEVDIYNELEYGISEFINDLKITSKK